jgi:hypothetical protein
MMTYTVASARANLFAIVDEVESGNDVALTRRGKKVDRRWADGLRDRSTGWGVRV